MVVYRQRRAPKELTVSAALRPPHPATQESFSIHSLSTSCFLQRAVFSNIVVIYSANDMHHSMQNQHHLENAHLRSARQAVAFAAVRAPKLCPDLIRAAS